MRILHKENPPKIQIDFFSKDLDRFFYLRLVLSSGDLLLLNGQSKKIGISTLISIPQGAVLLVKRWYLDNNDQNGVRKQFDSHPWPKIPRSRLYGYVVSTSTPSTILNQSKLYRPTHGGETMLNRLKPEGGKLQGKLVVLTHDIAYRYNILFMRQHIYQHIFSFPWLTLIKLHVIL